MKKVKISEAFSNYITFGVSDDTLAWIEEVVSQLGMGSQAELCRDTFENMARNGNGILKVVFAPGFSTKEFIKPDPALEIFDTGKKEKKKKEKKKTLPKLIYILRLPDNQIIRTKNLRKYLQDNWPQGSKEADKKYYDYIRGKFRKIPVRKSTADKHYEEQKIMPVIVFKLEREDGVLRRYSQGQESHARQCDELGNIIPKEKKEKEKKTPQKKSLGIKPKIADPDKCPKCGDGPMILKKGKYGYFYGCRNWQPRGMRDKNHCDGARSMKISDKGINDALDLNLEEVEVKQLEQPVVVEKKKEESPNLKLPLNDDYYKQPLEGGWDWIE